MSLPPSGEFGRILPGEAMQSPRATKPDREARAALGANAARLAFLEAFADAASDAAFGIDGDGDVTSWNRSAERIFGWSETDVVSAPVARLFRAEIRPTIEWFLDIVDSGDRIERFEVDVIRKGGMPTPISLTLYPTRDGAGGIAAIARDLTEQRLAQATLAEAEARLRDSEAAAHVGRWLWDIGSGTVQWSDELHRIHGIDPAEFNGDIDAHIAAVVPRDRERVREALARAVDLRRPFEEEYDIVRADAETRHIYLQAEPTFASNGAVLGLRGIIHDRSNRLTM